MKALAILLTAAGMAGCRPQMGSQPKYEAYEHSDFFADGSTMRPLPAHTLGRGQLDAEDAYHTGLQTDGRLVNVFPERVTPALVSRGREQFEIYCAVCHGLTGDGDGMIVQRGFPRPPTFHSDRLRGAPVGHFVDVINRG